MVIVSNFLENDIPLCVVVISTDSKGPSTQAIFVAATQCNSMQFCRAEVATSCDFIAILMEFVSVNVSTRLLLKQKLRAS